MGIKSILQFFGYDLRNKKITGSNDLLKRKTPIKIEFIGPPGVGKTTVSNFFINEISGNHKVISREQLIKNYPIETKLENIHKQLLEQKIQNLNSSSISDITKLELINYFKKIIYSEMSSRFVGDNKLLVLDEGIIHNFAPELVNFDFKSEEIRKILQNRFICLCTSSEDYIINNLTRGNRSAQQHPGYSKELKHEENYLLIKNQFKIVTQLKEKLIGINFPFVELDLEKGSLKLNSQKIKAELFNKYLLKL